MAYWSGQILTSAEIARDYAANPCCPRRVTLSIRYAVKSVGASPGESRPSASARSSSESDGRPEPQHSHSTDRNTRPPVQHSKRGQQASPAPAPMHEALV